MTRARLAGPIGPLLLLAALAGCRSHPQTPLTAAAAAGDVARVRALLAAHADPNEKDGSGWTPLQWAAREGHADAIRALLAGGASVDLRDAAANGWTPLMHAIHKNRNDAARALLDGGARVDARAGGGVTVLIMAAGYGNTAIVRELLARGADPRAEGEDGITALWSAAGGGAIADVTDGPPLGTCYPATIQALLEKAQDMRLKKGLPARVVAWLARSKECSEIVTRLSSS